VRDHPGTGSGQGAALFGYTSLYGSVPGGQAQYLRVPQAQFGPVKIPAGTPDEQYLYLSDILPTAYQAVAYADVPAGGTLIVLGLGPVGQMCVRIARHLGVERVIGVDPVPERRAAAAQFGVETLDPGALDDTAGTLVELTGGRGPDAKPECPGCGKQRILQVLLAASGCSPASPWPSRTTAPRSRPLTAWPQAERCTPSSTAAAALPGNHRRHDGTR
jgi:threonine dehydrogenase-like Zn-dependent dehydrogenase